jgi:hypothetical protein
MLESSWPASEIAQEHLQNLISQGYMTVTELATSRVLKDPPSFVPVGGGGDTAWCVRRSTCRGSVCHHIDFFARYYCSMAWSCIT